MIPTLLAVEVLLLGVAFSNPSLPTLMDGLFVWACCNVLFVAVAVIVFLS